MAAPDFTAKTTPAKLSLVVVILAAGPTVRSHRAA